AERFSPPTGDPGQFGNVLEASDLTPHPAAALAEELREPSAGNRDIVLLTHSRTLLEDEVQRLTREVASGSRLFALTATEHGEVEMMQIREGGTVPLSRFRVDFNSATAPIPRPDADGLLYIPWSGDIESIPYPFRFGLTNRIVDLAFDGAGRRLIAATVG